MADRENVSEGKVDYAARVGDLRKYMGISSTEEDRDPQVIYEDLCSVVLRDEGLSRKCVPEFP